MISLSRNIKGVVALAKDTFYTRRVRFSRDYEVVKFVHELTGIVTHNPGLYIQAFTHASCQSAVKNNERLEFLGDSILTSIVGHTVYEFYPEDNEGSLSQLRAYLVSRHRINEVARSLGFDQMVLTGGGIDLTHSDIIGNALEAFIGAIFLDKGYQTTANFVRKKLIISRKSLEESYEQEEDAKTAFIILMQKHKVPFDFAYTDSFTDETGTLNHRCDLRAGTAMRTISQGVGSSKKLAHQDAARKALHLIRSNPEPFTTWF